MIATTEIDFAARASCADSDFETRASCVDLESQQVEDNALTFGNETEEEPKAVSKGYCTWKCLFNFTVGFYVFTIFAFCIGIFVLVHNPFAADHHISEQQFEEHFRLYGFDPKQISGPLKIVAKEQDGSSVNLHARFFKPQTVRHPTEYGTYDLAKVRKMVKGFPELANAERSRNVFRKENASTLVIAIHGYDGSITGFDDEFGTFKRGDSMTGQFIAPALGSGFSVLAVELRNHGNSDKSKYGVSFGLYESLDVLAALQYVAEQKEAEKQFTNIDRVVLMGKSMGAASVIQALGSADMDPKTGELYALLTKAGLELTHHVVDSPPNSLKDALVHYPVIPAFFWRHLLWWGQRVCPFDLDPKEDCAYRLRVAMNRGFHVLHSHAKEDGIVDFENSQKIAKGGVESQYRFMAYPKGHCRAFYYPGYHAEMIKFIE